MDEEVFAFGSFRLIPAQRMLSEDGKPVRIGSRALDILAALAERAGETISKEELIARAWPDTVVEEAALRVHVAALRKALGDGRAGKRYIANLSGRGYAFIAPLTRESPLSATTAPARMAEAGNLPARLTRVIGRDEIVAALSTRLARRRFLTITGPGGIGKTTVAIAIADRVRASYKDGAWVVGLASLSDPDLVPSAVSAVLGVPLSGGDHIRALAAWLLDRNALLVLDSCEHVIGAAAALAEAILRAAPQAGILATSREPLRAEGEWLPRLAPLELPREATTSPTAAEALGYSAVELFNERATATMDSFVLGDTDVPAVLEICRRLDGVPLALELAAARVDAFGIGELAARLDARFGVLTSGRRTALPRHQTLRAALDWSYGLLSEPERRILLRLAVFVGYFTLEAASAVVASGDLTPSDALAGLSSLVAKSLISAEADGGPLRYRMLDTTRAYTLDKLAESGESGAVARRHAIFHRSLFVRAEADAATGPTDEWLADKIPMMDNLRAALDWAFSANGDASIGVTLTAAAVPLWMHLSLMEECRRRVEQALAAITGGVDGDTRSEMQLQAALAASLMYTRGAVCEVGAAGTKALEVAEGLGDAEYQLRSLFGLWSFRINSGEQRVGLNLAQRFYALAAKGADPNDGLIGERMIGTSQYFLGDLLSARDHLERVLAHDVAPAPRWWIARFEVDQWVAARAYLARILWLQGLPDQAMGTAESCIAEARAINHAISVGLALAVSACPIALFTGSLDMAEHYVEMLLDHSTTNALARWHAFGRGYQAMLAIQHGDLATGLQLLRAAFDEPAGAGSVPRFFTFLMAEVLGRAGQIADGLAAIEEAIVRSERSEEHWLVAELLRIKGELSLLQGAPGAAASAEGLFRHALDWAHRQGALSWELRCATSLARLWRGQARGEVPGLLASVYDRFTEGFDTSDLKAAKALLDDLS